jgi:biopolymer transport protein ExbD
MPRRRKPIPLVDPDLPITPMLDMSFQLLAFFIMETFRRIRRGRILTQPSAKTERPPTPGRVSAETTSAIPSDLGTCRRERSDC